jgi:predicted RNA-binding protein with PUA-like domain
MNYWLVKSEPETYSWERFVREGTAVWDGVRNYQARNNLKKMKRGDLVLFYHSVQEPSVVGIAKVTREFYKDPTTKDSRWVAVQLEPVKPLNSPVSLSVIKSRKEFQNMALVQQSRLSVMPVTPLEFERIIACGGMTAAS